MAYADQIAAAAQAQGVDPSLAIEVAMDESSLNPNAVGSKGEIGLFQLLPSSFPGVNPYDVNQNIQAGVGYLAQLLGKYGDPAVALAAYNWGPSNMDGTLAQYGSAWFAHIPSSTQNYVNKILGAVQTAYTPSFNPAGAPFPAPSSVLNIPPAALATPGSSIWATLAV